MRGLRHVRMAGWAGFVGLAVLLRIRAHHRGLIYPDGYQYLLMAKGIAVHLTPTLRLGPGGALFIPNVDAALKPLFPALTAALSGFLGLRGAADALTGASAAAVVLLIGLLTARLTGSRAAGVVAGAAALFSPGLAYWSGFTGPDPLAQALALATALVLASGRPRLAGALGALCAATRPEWLLVLGGAGLAGLIVRETRATASQSLLTGVFVLAAVIGLLRPPLGVPAGGAGGLMAALAGAMLLGLGAAWAGSDRRRAGTAATTALLAIALVCASGRVAWLWSLLSYQWPLLLLATAGIVTACMVGRGRPALMLLATLIVLGGCYAFRNPNSERYAMQLLPLLCVGAGFAVAALIAGLGSRAARSPRVALASEAAAAAVAAAAVAATALIAPPRPPLAPDAFAALAPRLAEAPAGTLYSAAPDAYGFLLPQRPQRPLRPGARGLILLDAAQRAYDAGLGARGTVIARLSPVNGFERPDGTLDMSSATLVRGVVVRR